MWDEDRAGGEDAEARREGGDGRVGDGGRRGESAAGVSGDGGEARDALATGRAWPLARQTRLDGAQARRQSARGEPSRASARRSTSFFPATVGRTRGTRGRMCAREGVRPGKGGRDDPAFRRRYRLENSRRFPRPMMRADQSLGRAIGRRRVHTEMRNSIGESRVSVSRSARQLSHSSLARSRRVRHTLRIARRRFVPSGAAAHTTARAGPGGSTTPRRAGMTRRIDTGRAMSIETRSGDAPGSPPRPTPGAGTTRRGVLSVPRGSPSRRCSCPSRPRRRRRRLVLPSPCTAYSVTTCGRCRDTARCDATRVRARARAPRPTRRAHVRVVNRIVNATERASLVSELRAGGAELLFVDPPLAAMHRLEYDVDRMLFAQAQNAAQRRSRRRWRTPAPDWVLPSDGNQFLPRGFYDTVRRSLAEADAKERVATFIPMFRARTPRDPGRSGRNFLRGRHRRALHRGWGVSRHVAADGTAREARERAGFRFDEGKKYGDRNKAHFVADMCGRGKTGRPSRALLRAGWT